VGEKGEMIAFNGESYSGVIDVSAQISETETMIMVEDLAGNTTVSQTEKVLLGTDGTERLTGGAENDFIFGFKGGDTLDGDAGDDTLVGGEDDDILYGEVGDDTLYGGLGDDELYGGEGQDRLAGGEGKDLFWFADSGDTGTSYEEIDVITDFISGIDTIDFDSLPAGNIRGFSANYSEDTNISLSSAIDNANDWLTDGNSRLYYISYVSLDHSTYILVDGDGDQSVDSIVELSGLNLDGIAVGDIIA
jgi:Ca2+-binding RTX toxin-like protein